MATNLEQRLQNKQQQPTLADHIRNMENQFQLAAPRGLEAQQLIRDALTCLRQTPKLAQCEPQTVLGALMTCAQLGLRPGVLGHSYLVPFRDNKTGTYQAQLIIGYQGLIELAHRSGQIQSLIARTVYQNDHFDVDYGLSDKLEHKPYMTGKKGDPIAYYAIVKYKGGGHAFFVMNHWEVEDHRDKYTRSTTGPWADNFEQMAHKTVVRKLAKWMPKSTQLAQAIHADETVRIDLAPDAINHTQHPQLEHKQPEQTQPQTTPQPETTTP